MGCTTRDGKPIPLNAGEGPFRPFTPLVLATSVEEEMGSPFDMRCGLRN